MEFCKTWINRRFIQEEIGFKNLNIYGNIPSLDILT